MEFNSSLESYVYVVYEKINVKNQNHFFIDLGCLLRVLGGATNGNFVSMLALLGHFLG